MIKRLKKFLGSLHFSGMTFTGIRSIFRKELIQLMRDPYLVGFIIALPVVQLLVTGLAIERDLSHIATVVANHDRRNASTELLKDFQQSTLFDVGHVVNSDEEVIQAIRKGNYRVGIIIPPDFSEKVMAGDESADINVIVDGTHGNIAKTIVSGAKMIVTNHTRKLMEQNTLQSAGSLGLVDTKAKILYNPTMQSAFFLVPAILAIVMHMLTILFTSFAIVRERETGTLEQLMVTPVHTSDLMLGKVLPYALIGFLDMILTLGVMVWFFDIAITGSFWFLCIASIIFILSSLGMGLIISTTCKTQVQAIQLTTGIFLPSLLLTGFVFPLEPMPEFIKVISYSLPLTYYLDIIRGVVIKGNGATELWFQTLVLMAMAFVMISFSILRFRKQVA